VLEICAGKEKSRSAITGSEQNPIYLFLNYEIFQNPSVVIDYFIYCIVSMTNRPLDQDSTTVGFLQKDIIDFFQNAPIGIHSLSDKGIILWANDAELKSLGYSAEEYIGHSVVEVTLPASYILCDC
jgi:PAS domain-containing protein